MIQISAKDKEKVLEAIRKGKIDAADISFPNLIDTIILKMKIKTSLTDVPFAITDAETLSKIGYNVWDSERNLEERLMSGGAIRNFVKKYKAEEFIQSYNTYVQEYCIYQDKYYALHSYS